MLTTWNKRADAQAANLLLPLTNDFMSFIVHHCIISLSSDGAIYDYFRSVQKSLSLPILHYSHSLTVTVYDMDHLPVDWKPRFFKFAYP